MEEELASNVARKVIKHLNARKVAHSQEAHHEEEVVSSVEKKAIRHLSVQKVVQLPIVVDLGQEVATNAAKKVTFQEIVHKMMDQVI